MSFKDDLIELGFKPAEADIYMSCLRAPYGLFVNQIVAQTKVQRSTVDLMLHRLRDAQYIARHKEGARWVYTAEDPERIVFSYQEKVKGLTKAATQLKAEMEGFAAPVTKFYEGEKGVKALYDDMLITMRSSSQPRDRLDNSICIISSGQDLIRALPKHGKEFTRKRINNGIHAHILAPDTAISRAAFKPLEKQLRQTRFFDAASYGFTTEINIYANKVAHISFSEHALVGTVIANPQIAHSMRSLFTMIWEQAKK
jgi:predicted transcriptional regulator